MSKEMNYICVNSSANEKTYVNVDTILYIRQEESVTKIIVNHGFVETKASADEIMDIVAGMGAFNINTDGDIPLIGFPKVEKPEPEVVEVEDESIVADSHYDPSPAVQKIANIVERYNEREPELANSYTSFADMLKYTDCVEFKTIDNTKHVMKNIESNEIVCDDGVRIPFHKISDNEIDYILGELNDRLRYDLIYNYVCNQTSIRQDIAIYNLNHPIGDEGRIEANTEENLNKFGLSAGELMKSMVDGKYRKDDDYITINNGELQSFNGENTQDIFFCSDIADILINRPDYVKCHFPGLYDDVFC